MVSMRKLGASLEKADRFILNSQTCMFECVGCDWSVAAEFPMAIDSLVDLPGKLNKLHPRCPDGELDTETARFHEESKVQDV